MSTSYKNTSSGENSSKHLPIKENVDPRPPAGASNSYEKVYEGLCRKDDSSLSKKPYSKEKMRNK